VDWPQSLAAEVACATTVEALLEVAGLRARRVFRASAGGILVQAASEAEVTSTRFGLRAQHAEEYVARWMARDPVLREARARRVAVREQDLPTASSCAGKPFCADFGRRVGISAYLVAPLYGVDGAIAGSIHLGRAAAAAPFSAGEVEEAVAFSAFVSAMLARLPQRTGTSGPRLAPREHQVACLVSRGLSNPRIASELGLARETVKQTLRRIYRKTNVSNRTELAAHYLPSRVSE
jgi:DNA-binding CsgD family transcriptional regulator